MQHMHASRDRKQQIFTLWPAAQIAEGHKRGKVLQAFLVEH